MFDRIRIKADADGPFLGCVDHPKWEGTILADSTLRDVISAGVDHLREEHRTHVKGCQCRDRVTDIRCLPSINWADLIS